MYLAHLSASMMCANLMNLREEVSELEKNGITHFHLDLMDGHFVKNYSLGFEDIKAIRLLTNETLELHAMISNPDDFIDDFILMGIDQITLHPETLLHPLKTLEYIQGKGVEAGIAISPSVPLCLYEPLYEYCDYILIMSVNPGFAGQKIIKNISVRIEEALKYKEKYQLKIGLDGAVSPTIVKEFSGRIDYYVLGTSSLFNSNSIADNVENLRF